MRIVSDLHIHSRFSRACSKDITISNLEKYAKVKGISLLGTGDFTHPLWLKELKKSFEDDGTGILRTKSGFPFILSSEVSNIYSQDGKGRRVHNIILAPSFDVVEQINSELSKRGRLDYDGRPMFGFSCIELVEMMKSISDDIEVIPAHCLPPKEVVFCKKSLLPISAVKKGMKVMTHKGRFKRVSKVFKRRYKGDVIKIKPSYFGGSLTTTPEHPYYAIKIYKYCSWTKGTCKPVCSSREECKKKVFLGYNPEWIQAKDLEKKDVLLYPITKGVRDKFIGVDKKEEPDLWRLIGYYLSEGWSNKRDGIGFCFNAHEEEYVKDLIYLINKYFKKEAKIKIRGNSIEVLLYSKKLMRLFENLCYNSTIKRAKTKCLPQWTLFLPLEKQKELFLGWWRGDLGVSSSLCLFNQMKNIALRLGIIPNIGFRSKEKFNEKDHIITSKGKTRNVIASEDNYQMHHLTFFRDKFGLLNTKEFSKFRRKINRFKGWMDENYVYLPLLEVSNENYKGLVYNLEVEGDNSYVTEICSVHNCWTPWFALFGSMSGFDSVKDCFKDQTKHIHALETGLSSDPAMNWRLSQLDKYALVSFSDAHSVLPWRIGREATIFEIDLTYKSIINALRTKKGLVETIETNPAYGKYHFDGHRACNVHLSPKESNKLKGICPVCKRPLTIGVLNRVEELADREEGFTPEGAKPFKSIIPLSEVIAEVVGVKQAGSKKVLGLYNKFVEKFGSEMNVLIDASLKELSVVDEKVAMAVVKIRDKEVNIRPGFDGVYGKIGFGTADDKIPKIVGRQTSLSQF